MTAPATLREKMRARICRESCGSECIYRNVCEKLADDLIAAVLADLQEWSKSHEGSIPYMLIAWAAERAGK